MGSKAARLVIELAVGKIVKDSSRGTLPRSLRKLADLTGLLSSPDSQGPDTLAGQMLRDEQHPYYAAVEKLLSQTDRRYINSFFINLGYESISCGGAVIRKQHQENGCWIPWLMGLPLPSAPGLLEPSVRRGVLSYLLLSRSASAQDLAALCRAWPTAAFFGAVPDALISEALLKELNGIDNLALMPVVRGLHGASFETLRASRRPFFPLFLIREEEIRRILGADGFASVDDPDLFAAFFLPDSTVSVDMQKAFTDYLISARLSPQGSFVPMDFSCDLLGIEQAIAGNAAVRFSLPDGFDPAPLLIPGAPLTAALELLA